MSPSRAVIVGASPEIHRARRGRGELWIAVDGGLDHCRRWGVTPDLWVGDGDSIRLAGRKRSWPEVRLPCGKDRSDLHYALRWLSECSGLKELLVYGVLGGRPDHHLASLQEIALFASKSEAFRTIAARDARSEYHWISPHQAPWRHPIPKGTVLSLFPLLGRAQGVSTRGLRYPLQRATLRPGSCGLSNEVLSSKLCQISLTSGMLLCIVPYEP